jgi:predicted glycosyltransferase
LPIFCFFLENHTVQNYNPEIFNIYDNTKIWGFYQTDKYFTDNEDDVKSWFNIESDSITESILEKYPIDEYCYIHFRGTDYKEWDGGKRFLPIEYYKTAMNKILETKKMKFLVITDDIKLASEFFKDTDIISNDMMVDFKLIYYSKYCIITNSTFSWWAAWLSNKVITIAPNNWLNYNNPELGFYPVDIKTNKFQYVDKL